MKTIVVAVDFSPATEAVIAQAAALARSLYARVVLMHVTEPVATVVDFAIVTVSVAHLNEEAVARAKKRLGQLKDELNASGLDAEVLHVVGSPGREIIDQAKAMSADYIVLGSHGHTAFYDLVVGSTTSAVLKRAPCPTVIVPVSSHRFTAVAEKVSEEATP